MPALMLVDSPWRPAKILHSRPAGKPPVAKQLAEYDYSQVTRDMAHLMKNHDANVRAGVKENWAAFVAQRPKEQADADVNSCLPNWDRFVIRPPDAATGGHRANARSAARTSVRRLPVTMITRKSHHSRALHPRAPQVQRREQRSGLRPFVLFWPVEIGWSASWFWDRTAEWPH